MPIHPSKDIISSIDKRLEGRKVAICITGSVAAVQCPEIARALMRHGAEVFPVMSAAAQKVIHPNLMEWASGNPVVTELTGRIEHVALAGEHPEKADLVLIAPATANTIGKVSCGVDDTPVTSIASTALGSGIPIMIVPAMHESMYKHPVLRDNIKKLSNLGVQFVGPRFEEGKAKIAKTEEIVEAALNRFSVKQDLSRRSVLITAGPTLEYIDPIRTITNKSTGKMGLSLVGEALARGAEVTLIYGPGREIPTPQAQLIRVETSEDMHEAVVAQLRTRKYDLMVAAAAVTDWIPHEPSPKKISTGQSSTLKLTLKPTKKIIHQVKTISPETFLVAFCAEYRTTKKELVKRAHSKLSRADADLIVANDTGMKGTGYETDTNEVFIIDRKRRVIHIPLAPKREVARQIINIVVAKMASE